MGADFLSTQKSGEATSNLLQWASKEALRGSSELIHCPLTGSALTEQETKEPRAATGADHVGGCHLLCPRRHASSQTTCSKKVVETSA